MTITPVPGWLLGLRSALAEIARREVRPGPANSRIARDWTETYQALLAKVPEFSLLAANHASDDDRSTREADILFAEMKRRGIDA